MPLRISVHEGHILLAALWALWCFLHSALLARPVTDWLKWRLQSRYPLYRLGFVCFSVLTILPIVLFEVRLHQQVLFDWSGPWRLLQALLLIYAGVLFIAGAREYDLAYFLGVRQWRDWLHHRRPVNLEFRTGGILRYVRHPWYSGGIAFVAAFGPLTDASLVAKLILTVYLVVGAKLEERKLLALIGEPYHSYCRRVPMLVPGMKRAS